MKIKITAMRRIRNRTTSSSNRMRWTTRQTKSCSSATTTRSLLAVLSAATTTTTSRASSRMAHRTAPKHSPHNSQPLFSHNRLRRLLWSKRQAQIKSFNRGQTLLPTWAACNNSSKTLLAKLIHYFSNKS